MSYLDPHTNSPPPPAYCADEFDRKTSVAINQSLTTPQPQYPPEEEWETWDGDAFTAAAQALASSNHHPQLEKHCYLPSTSHAHHVRSGSSGSSLPGPPFHAVEPLNIKKKTSDQKPRPSWLSEAEMAVEQGTAPFYSSAGVAAHQPPSDHEENTIHPPAFASRGPSLDGPPYEQVMATPWDGDGSTLPPSPCSPPRSPSFYYPSQPDNQRRVPRHSLPVPPEPVQRFLTPQRPNSEHSPYKLTTPPMMPISTFDPSMAYNQDSEYNFSHRPARGYDSQDHVYDATSLYNASVANHMRSQLPRNTLTQVRGKPSGSSNLGPNRPAREWPHDSLYGHGLPTGMAAAQNPAAPRFIQYPNTHVSPHLIG